MKKAQFVLAGIALFLLVFSAGAFAQKIDLKMMTGPMGGSWYPWAEPSRMPSRKKFPA